MAVTKTLVKIGRQQAVVKCVASGGGTANISLAELAKSDETIDFANTAPRVTISGLFNTVDALTTITRNGSNVLVLAAAQQDKWDFNQSWGFVLDENANANITVNFGAAGNGSIILILGKTAGYTPPDLNALKDYQK